MFKIGHVHTALGQRVCFLGLSAPGVPASRGLGWSPAAESERSKGQVEGGRARDGPTLLYTRTSAKSGCRPH